MDKKSKFLAEYIVRQVANFFPDDFNIKDAIMENTVDALQRTVRCINSIIAWRDQGFNYLVSGQYATFLYFLSNCIWKNSANADAATRIFLLNKALNGIDLFYEIEMPQYFGIAHTVGMVFSKGTYGEYCLFHQGCTVGRHGVNYPTIEAGVVMFPGSMILGNCLIRENTVISPGVILINTETPGDCYAFPGDNGKPVFKKLERYFADEIFTRSIPKP